VSNLDSLSREELVVIIHEQRRALLELQDAVEALNARVSTLEEENEDLRSRLGGGGKTTPHWVKPNRAGRRKKQRKKRHKSFVRPREAPTEIVEHALDECPDCGRKLSGGTVHHSRQVIEIPITPVRVIEHRVIARYCGVCGKTHMPKLDLSGEAIGTHRVGVRLMSLVSYLYIVGRMPKERVQGFLEALYGLHLGLGEITKILHKVAQCGRHEVDRLREAIRGSPAVNADETGWREDGVNGYIWSFSTPDVRYFIRDRSRSGKVAESVLGQDYEGVVVSDFYCGYNVLLGAHQRCWAHLLRDLHALVETNPGNRGVAIWAGKVKAVYERAKAYKSEDVKARHKQRILFEEELFRLARPYLKRDVPQRILSERIEEFLSELFVFVECPEVPSENNAAERAIRPAVTARKVSGGTRSPKGSETRMALMSLFGTWLLRGEDAMESCLKMLTGKTSLAPTASM
jgi:hypothetical protein